MHRKLTEQEIEKKKHFERLSLPNTDSNERLDTFESTFHLTMQNPVDKMINFDGLDRQTLHNGYLNQLSQYFCKADGGHLFDREVEQLSIRGICLVGYNHDTDQMPDGTQYIANLIAKNPKIEVLDLSNTQLGNNEAKILLQALATNTRLMKLRLYGNFINGEDLDAINDKIVENNVRRIDHRLVTEKLEKYLEASLTAYPGKLFKFQAEAIKKEIEEKTALIDAHLDVMDQIKMRRR